MRDAGVPPPDRRARLELIEPHRTNTTKIDSFPAPTGASVCSSSTQDAVTDGDKPEERR